MKILIGGGSGFIGRHLCQHFLQQGQQISLISRTPEKTARLFSEPLTIYAWENLTTDILKEFDLVINLAGANIGEERWNSQRKRKILESRIATTKKLADLCSQLEQHAPRLFNASAIGIYGLQSSCKNNLPIAYDEQAAIDFESYPDFLSEVGRKWEKATWPAKKAGCQVVNLRFAVVIDKSGGVFKKLALPFYFGLGGPIGSGKQPFCWISLIDLISAIDFLIAHPEISGPVNLVVPECLTQQAAAKIFGKKLHRPSFIRTPSFILKMIFGQMATELLLNGQHVKPSCLLQAGFKFQHNKLEQCL